MQAFLEPLDHRLARAAVHGLAFVAAVLVLIGIYVHVLRSAVARGPLLRPPPTHAAISRAACGPTPVAAVPPGRARTRQTALR